MDGLEERGCSAPGGDRQRWRERRKGNQAFGHLLPSLFQPFDGPIERLLEGVESVSYYQEETGWFGLNEVQLVICSTSLSS